MARIQEAELERLKGEVSLVRLIEAQGHRLTSQGKDLACRCPWHEGDVTPSRIVTPKTNLWHCFGCGAGGTVIDWMMRSHRISFRHACELHLKEHPALAAGVEHATHPLQTQTSAERRALIVMDVVRQISAVASYQNGASGVSRRLNPM